ncbi:hypothetical protein PR202_gb06221 [Eleusine coracana subsp. coracana]|uniref:CCT domain-containing protein n=1 Tax=Eleusine coracana subsp. coracana TaxID=191504 RepID=A0AAV5E8U4_ELECO|nr:hypothetical protein PR202_gb06221 [Eleusine coracana subsp. coracana]
MSSSCIPTGLRLDLEMVKAAASPGAHSSPLRAAHSSPSSTLSEASNASSSATSVSLKRARAPQDPKTAARPQLTAAFDPLLPPLPVLADAAFLLRDTPPPQSPLSGGKNNCSSPAPVSSAFRDFRDPAPPSPASPEDADDDELGEIDFDEDRFDAESILDEAAGDAAEGIDSIMGSLTVESSSTAAATDDSILSSSGIHPYLRSLMVVGLAGRFELGLGFRHAARPNLNRALKRRDDDGAWWMWPAVPVKDLTVAPPPPPPATTTATPEAASNTGMPTQAAPEKKKSKKKKVVKMEKVMAKAKEEMPNAKCKEEAVDAANGDGDARTVCRRRHPRPGWGSSLTPTRCSRSGQTKAKLADIDLFPENGAGGIREASVLRYKEKRRTRLFSKKIRYQVRKGRFVRSPSLLQQALEEES